MVRIRRLMPQPLVMVLVIAIFKVVLTAPVQAKVNSILGILDWVATFQPQAQVLTAQCLLWVELRATRTFRLGLMKITR